MADYINIYGQDILAVASDPANPTVGQIWYNTTSNTLKGGGVTTAAAWATANPLNTARYLLGGAGTQTAALAFGGNNAGKQSSTEKYDGTSWTAAGTMNLARDRFASGGVQTAAFAAGGEAPPGAQNATEEYTGAGAPQTKTITVS